MFGKNKNGCFDCDRCPENADPTKGRFCVAWWEGVEENTRTGETKVFKMCGFVAQKRLLDEVAMASRSNAAALESTRNHVGHLVLKAVTEAREQAFAQPLLINGNGRDQGQEDLTK